MNSFKGSLFNNSELEEIVNRYHTMIFNGNRCFFDVHEFSMLIEYFIEDGKLDDAFNAVDYALLQYPLSDELKISKVQILIDKGMSLDALNLIKEIEEFNHCDAELFLLKGIALNFTNHPVEALKNFKKAISLSDEGRADTLFSIAINYENLNDFSSALIYLKEAIELEPENLTIIFELGYCSDRSENFKEAIHYYNVYLDIDPFSDLVWFNLGIVHTRAGNFDLAIEAYDFAIAINQKHELAYFNKANALANQGNYAQAIESYTEHLEFEDDHAETYCFIGECYERMGNIERALEFYNKTLSLSPDYADAIYGIGIVHSICDNFFQSLKYINRAIEINPDCAEYYFSQGSVYGRLNNADKAIESYIKATTLDPTDYESWLNLSELYLKKNLLSKAIKTLEEAYRFNSDIALINYRLAAYYLLKHNVEEGVSFFRKAISNNFADHKELLKFYPEAYSIKEIKELIKQHNLY